MEEFELIRRIIPLLPTSPAVVVGAGDDCAAITPPPAGEVTLMKTDAVVEGFHFLADTDPARVGHKALGRCLSDVAAMGGTATAALVTLAMPAETDWAWVEAVYGGMRSLALQHGVAIVGGETTTSPERRLISVALVGAAPRASLALRSGARAGDAVFVTGELGGSIAGRHLDIVPRLPEGRWLAREFGVTSMVDVSDGLAGDLGHVLQASGVGAELRASAIPISRAARVIAQETSQAKPALLAALTDGEDFELVFTIAKGRAVALMDGWKQQFPDVRLSCIGRITPAPGLRLRDERGLRELSPRGYTHFSQRHPEGHGGA